MAKKKTVLSIEERLQQALVPKEEQPYEVPENWVWTRLGYVSEIVTGGTPSKKHSEYYGDDLPFYKPADLDSGRYVYNASEYLSIEGKKVSRLIPQYSTAVCCIGSIGKCGFLLQEGTTNQQINSIISKLEPLLIYYYACSDIFQKELSSKASATTIAIVNKRKMEQCLFPLPPLSEQHRIVARIEELFAKLDEAKENLQEEIDGFETRKAAILHKAFTGEFTKKWRKEHGVGIDSWKVLELNKVSKVGSGGTPSRKNPDYFNGHIPWIKTGEINWNMIYDSEESISNDAIDNSSAKVYPKGTVVVAMYGQGLTRGRAAILGIDATTNQAVCALQPNKYVNNFYLFYYFMEHYWDYRQRAFGGNQPNYSATMIANWIINLPSLAEQQEIVRIVDSLLDKEQKAKEAAESVLEQIDLMKKSILARAFRGELGTNDPAEPSSMELLKQVLADKE